MDKGTIKVYTKAEIRLKKGVVTMNEKALSIEEVIEENSPYHKK